MFGGLTEVTFSDGPVSGKRQVPTSDTLVLYHMGMPPSQLLLVRFYFLLFSCSFLFPLFFIYIEELLEDEKSVEDEKELARQKLLGGFDKKSMIDSSFFLCH